MSAYSLPTALAFSCMVAFVVAFYYGSVSKTLRPAAAPASYILLAISYGAYGVRVICQFAQFYETLVFSVLTDLLYIVWITALWLGVRSYDKRTNIAPHHFLAPAFLVLWYAAARASELSFSWRLIPQHTFGAFLFGLAGYHLLQVKHEATKGWRYGVSIMLWLQGITTASYPFTRETWFAPYGFFIFATLALAVGMGLMLIALAQEQQELQQAEEQIRLAATAFEAQEGMFITNAESVIQRVNQAFTKISGYTAEDAVGQKPNLLYSEQILPSFYATVQDSIGHCGTWQGEIWNRRKSGELYLAWLSITAVRGADGPITHYVGMLTDITAQKAAEAQIEHLAYYDTLTALPNRQLLSNRLQQALDASIQSGRKGALLVLDLDNFKNLNDTVGHDIGDMLLKQAAARLASCTQAGNTLSRVGGDEFAIILEDLSAAMEEAATQAKVIGDKILAALSELYLINERRYRSSASIGCIVFGEGKETKEELLKQAELALYQAKAAGRNAIRFFQANMQELSALRAAIENDLHDAIRAGHLVLYYQPQVDEKGHVIGAEALVRWRHPQRGLILPGEFISLAEETGLIMALGRWVLEDACAQLVNWSRRFHLAGFSLAVNVSVRQFRHPDFVSDTLSILEKSGVDPNRLKLELTENLLLDDVEDVIAKMALLKQHGVGFSLDDFGTGYSSLTYLKRLPIDQVKIDRSFIRDVLTDMNDAAIARAIVALGRTMGLNVVAEGVESTEQLEFLTPLGCHAFQGYLFGRPLPVDQFEFHFKDIHSN